MINDKIADLIIRIKNASERNKKSIEVDYTKINENILKILKDIQVVENFKKFKLDKKDGGFNMLNISLYQDIESFKDLKRVSKLSRRVYFDLKKLISLKSRNNIYILTTPKGVMSHQDAIKKKTGGEVLLKVTI